MQCLRADPVEFEFCLVTTPSSHHTTLIELLSALSILSYPAHGLATVTWPGWDLNPHLLFIRSMCLKFTGHFCSPQSLKVAGFLLHQYSIFKSGIPNWTIRLFSLLDLPNDGPKRRGVIEQRFYCPQISLPFLRVNELKRLKVRLVTLVGIEPNITCLRGRLPCPLEESAI